MEAGTQQAERGHGTRGGRPGVCVIGAGSSGIAACQVLNARGIPFDAYVDNFGFRDDIRFRTEVKLVEAAPEGGWNVTLDDGTTTRYDTVLVANGHHWNARWPDPPFPGEFSGRQMHALGRGHRA